MFGESLHLLCVFVNVAGLLRVGYTQYSHMYIAILKNTVTSDFFAREGFFNI